MPAKTIEELIQSVVVDQTYELLKSYLDMSIRDIISVIYTLEDEYITIHITRTDKPKSPTISIKHHITDLNKPIDFYPFCSIITFILISNVKLLLNLTRTIEMDYTPKNPSDFRFNKRME